MTPSDLERLRQQLILHEGKRAFPYRCSSGKLSIGVGYNLDDRGLAPLRTAIARHVTVNDLLAHGLPDAEILRVLDADILYFETKVAGYLGVTWERLDPVRQRVVIDFVFNVGPRGALGFTRAIAALRNAVLVARSDERRRLYFTEAAFELMRSLWFTQVGDGYGKTYDRAERLIDMLLTGKDYVR